ncbi:hypothetical protein BH09SUM1_BH09SUM1_25020 [soil metagenome]
MEPLIRPIRNLFANTNYVYLVEIIVILSIIALLLFIMNALGLLKKTK